MRMTKVEVVGGSTKDLLTRLKVTTLIPRSPLMNAAEHNSRSGASPLSLHHSSQKVNPCVKSKIRKEKRKVKGLMTKARTQVSRTLSQKYCHQCRFPPRSKELHREFSDLTISSVPDSRIVPNVNVWCRMVTASRTSNLEHIWWRCSSWGNHPT